MREKEGLADWEREEFMLHRIGELESALEIALERMQEAYDEHYQFFSERTKEAYLRDLKILEDLV